MTFSVALRKRPDREDVIVVGSLSVIALWLFVALPLLDLYSELDSQQGSEMTTIWVATVIIGFLGGSVMAWAIGRFQTWLSRPILAAHLIEGRGCYVTTARGNPRTHDAQFLRLLVENGGRSTINKCNAYIIRITQIRNGVSTHLENEVLELQWSTGGSSDARSIPPKAFFYMNIAHVELVPGAHALFLGVTWTPNHYSHVFGGNAPAASFELLIRLVADNAGPIDHIVRFSFDPNWQDLQIEYD